jgi:RNA polymerase sigma-70 factor, ECF subfamily
MLGKEKWNDKHATGSLGVAGESSKPEGAANLATAFRRRPPSKAGGTNCMKSDGISVVTKKGSNTLYELPDASDDLALVARARSGCSVAFGQLYDRHRGKVFRAVLHVVRQKEDAEDATQRCFQRAFTNLGTFRGESRFSTWVTRIAINEALMLLRRRRAHLPLSDSSCFDKERACILDLPDESPTPEESLAADEVRAVLMQGISDLRKHLQVVVLLREFQGLSNEEIARRLGLTVSAVKARVYHARRRLRRHLERKLNFRRKTLNLL